MKKNKKEKVKKTKKPMYKKEFIFNIISLIIVILICLYFGVRGFYYYGKQNATINKETSTLAAEVIKNNTITKEETGLHQDENGYYFKGKVTNNYVKFANRYFRIIRINNDNTTKLISEDVAASFPWGDEESYQKSNLSLWLNKTENEYSGVYYDTIPNQNKFLVKTEYSEDTLESSKVKQQKKKEKAYISTLTINDYIMASGKNSYLNNSKYFWLLGLDNDKMNLYVNEEGSVESSISYESYGVRAVITFKKDIKISAGDGSLSNPYVIDQKNDINYVDSYVKLGNDTWKVYQDKSNVLKLSLDGYVQDKTGEYQAAFSNKSSLYDPLNRYNIAYYLNKTYYSNLSYNNLILESNFNIGEISADEGYSYLNIYKDSISNKVGLLNIFDYNTNTNLSDYYFLNKTSTVGSMAYVYSNTGLLEEDEVTTKKHVVPTISIDKNILKQGTGSKEDPYRVE